MSPLIEGKKYVVYQLRAENSEREFYIGKTYEGSGRFRTHLNGTCEACVMCFRKISSLKSKGIKVVFEILGTFDKEEDALSLEIRLISEKGRLIDGSGYLTNITAGGEGSSGRPVSEESREKLSKSLLSPSSKFQSIWDPVTAFTLKGEFVRVYQNMGRASYGLDIPLVTGAVSKACSGRHRYAKSRSGVLYQFIKGVWLDDIPSQLRGKLYDRCGVILQYSLSGELIARYSNSMVAAESTGIRKDVIRYALTFPNSSPRSYFWRKEKVMPDDSKYVEW